MKDEYLNMMICAEEDPELYGIVRHFLQHEVSAADRLSVIDRHLCVLSALMGCQGADAFEAEVCDALAEGVEPAVIRETVYQATAYLGIGRVLSFLKTLDRVLKAQGVSLPLALQGTTDADDRFERGLEKQVQLFGEGMRKQQTQAPHPRRNINRWLAANCFGDYYTRKGLDDAQRELVTFCLILAQGGCENQLRGHTAGNIGAGNDADKLYAAVEQCMPYIGYPRSLNAMNIIDEVAGRLTQQ